MSKKRQAETAAALETTPSAAEIADYDAREWERGNASAPPPAAVALGVLAPAPVEFRLISPGLIHPSPLNPRQKAASDEDDLNLALSVAQKGVLQPIMVRPARQLDLEGEAFEIIMG